VGQGPGRRRERGEQGVAERRGERGGGIGVWEEAEVREGVGEAAVAEQRGGGERAGCRGEQEPRGTGAGERGEEGGEVRRDGREVGVEGVRAGGGRRGGGRGVARRVVGTWGDGEGARGGGGEAREEGGWPWGHRRSEEKARSWKPGTETGIVTVWVILEFVTYILCCKCYPLML
jgi:hypothetical protein